MMNIKRVHLERVNFGQGVNVFIVHKLGEKEALAKPLTFEEVDPHSMFYEPTVHLSMDGAQNLMDELWRCGLRPSEGTGSAGSLAATQSHLRDMQNIVYGILEKQGVKR